MLRSSREDDLRPSAALVSELEGPLQLVPNQRTHDREAGAGANFRRDTAVVRDHEHRVAVPACKLDPHLVAAVLERVLEELAEDERQRGGAVSGKRDRLEICLDPLP